MLGVVALVATFAVTSSLVATSASAEVARGSIGAGLTGPTSLHATVLARRLQHVAALAEDDSGHVWAATATGSTDAADGVYVIDDAGHARLVIDDVDAPTGLLWDGGDLYVARHAGIERYDGYDGTTFAEHHPVLTLPDDVGLVSGLARLPDGRLVTGVSAPCDACTPSSPWSASVVTVGTDGADPHVLVRDVRAAVGFAVVPSSGVVLATMNQRDDLGRATPGDWLGAITDGQSWGFPACYGQSGTACAGVPHPVAVLGKHAAVTGVAVLTGPLATRTGSGAAEAAAVAEWMAGEVRVVPLTASAGRGAVTAAAFLGGFEHPAPVIVTHTGALLVGDWGTGRVVRVTAARS